LKFIHSHQGREFHELFDQVGARHRCNRSDRFSKFRKCTSAGRRYNPHRLSEIVDVDGDDQNSLRNRIGDDAIVGPGNELMRGARVWPGVRLEPTSIRFSSDA